MTAKTTIKNETRGPSKSGAAGEEMQTACQVHTLAQMLYGHLAMTHPWFVAPPALGVPFEPSPVFRPMQTGPGPASGIALHPRYEPMTGFQAMDPRCEPGIGASSAHSARASQLVQGWPVGWSHPWVW